MLLEKTTELKPFQQTTKDLMEAWNAIKKVTPDVAKKAAKQLSEFENPLERLLLLEYDWDAAFAKAGLVKLVEEEEEEDEDDSFNLREDWKAYMQEIIDSLTDDEDDDEED